MERGLLYVAGMLVCASSAALAGPRASPPDTTLHHGTLAIPFELCGNLAFVPVRVNSSDTLSFLIDSGANACVIDIGHAKQLGLKRLEQVEGSGAGKGPVTTWILDNQKVTFGLPGLDVRADLVAALDLSNNLSVVGRRVDGILGYDLFDRFLVEIDYDTHTLFLSSPDSMMSSDSGIALPLVFFNRLPHVEVMLTPFGHDPVRQTLLIDSGSNDAVDDSLLALSTSSLVETVSGVGQGKEFRSVAGRWQAVQLGSLSLSGVPGGAGGVPLIGGEVLRRFTVVFDVHHQQIILQPNRHSGDAFLTDASGLNLRFVPNTGLLRVHDVTPRSPAQEAGFRVDDELLSMDGVSVRTLGLGRVQCAFEQTGRQYRLLVKRGSDEQTFVIVTRAIL